jgi:hypothetical protein
MRRVGPLRHAAVGKSHQHACSRAQNTPVLDITMEYTETREIRKSLTSGTTPVAQHT